MRFQRRREQAVDTLTPLMASGLESAVESTDQTLTQLAAATQPSRHRVQEAFRERRPASTPAAAPDLRPLAEAFAPAGPFLPEVRQQLGGQVAQEFFQAFPDIGREPVTPGTVFRDGIRVEPPRPPRVGEIAFGPPVAEPKGFLGSLASFLKPLEHEREAFRPFTEPVGRAVGGLLGQAALSLPLGGALRGVPAVEEPVREAFERAGEVAGPEILAIENIIPLPVIDAAGARLLGLGVKLATRAGRAELRTGLRVTAARADNILRRARTLVERGDKRVPENFVTELQQRLAPELQVGEAPVPQFGAEAPSRIRQIAAEPVEDVLSGDPADMVTLFRGLAREGDELFAGAHLTPNRADAELFARTDALDLERQGLTGQPRVVEVSVRRDALRALGPESETAISRGGVRLGDPSQARVVEAGAAAVPPGAPPGPVERAAPPPPEGLRAMGGGSRLTAEEVAARRAAGADVLASAIPQSGKRAGINVWRRFFGARNLSGRERAVWSRQVYRDAERAGFKIARRGESQSDEIVGIMERVMDEKRAPVTEFAEEQQPFVQSLYDRLDRTTQRLVDADPEFAKAAMPDYFPHLFKTIKPGKVRLMGQPKGFVTRPGFQRERKLTGPLGEILRDRPDLDLVSWDPVDFVTRHEAAADNYIASLDAIRTGKAAQMIVPASQAPSDWVRPDFAPFKLRQTLQHHVMEPKFAQVMEQMFGKSIFDTHGALKAAKNVRTAAFAAKVFGGLFQQVDFGWRALGLGTSELARGRPGQARKSVAAWFRAMGRGLSPDFDDAMSREALKNPKLQALLRNGHAGGYDPSFSEAALRDVAGELGPIPGVRQAMEAVTSGWYGRFHAAMMDEAGLIMLEKNLRKGLPLEEAARLAVEENNVFFSSIPAWQSVWKSATARDAMKFPFFATGELEAWFRLPVQAPAGFAGMMAATVAVAEMMNLAFTGKPLSLSQINPVRREGGELKPGRIVRGDIPFVDFNTGFLRPQLPWRGPGGRKLYLDLLGQADTPFRWALAPGFATQTRLGQIPRLALDLLSIGRGEAPPFGEVVRGPKDALQFILQQISPISVSGLAGTERGRIGLIGAGTQTTGFNISAEPLFELLARRFEEVTGETFNRETDWGRASRLPETAPILDQMRDRGLAVGSEASMAAQAREDVVHQAARDSLTQFADGVRAGNEDAGRQFGEKFSDWKTFAAGAAELSMSGREFPDPTSEHGQILAEFYEVSPNDFLDGDPEEGTFTTDWVAFENARDELLAQMPEAWQEDYRSRLRLPAELQDVEAQYNAARELRNRAAEIGEFEGLSEEDYQLVKRLRAAVTQARNEAFGDPTRRGRELAPVQWFIESEGERLGYDARLINWTRALSSERDRAENYNSAYVDFLGEHEAELRLFYPNLFTRRIVDELMRS